MLKTELKLKHINATSEDLAGNHGIGRYVLITHSDLYAQEIADRFERPTVKHHPSEHNLYLGTLKYDGQKMDVASIQTGVGCASLEMILHELFLLGAKRFLYIGTAGTLQPELIEIGSFINVQASVRDEGTTRQYAPIELPAIASLEFITAILVAAEKLDTAEKLHTGIVHCKSAYYAHEYTTNPRASEIQHYSNMLKQAGVLAAEMSTSALFIQTQLYNYQLMQHGSLPQHRALAGAILAVTHPHDDSEEFPETLSTMQEAIELGLETVKVLASQEVIG